MRVLVNDQPVASGKRFPTTRMIADKVFDFFVDDLHVPAERCELIEGLVANFASLVVFVVLRVVVRVLQLAGVDLRTELAVEHAVNNVVEEAEGDVWVATTVGSAVSRIRSRRTATALPLMNLDLGDVRETVTAAVTVEWRWDVVMSIHVDVQRVLSRVEERRTHLEEGARELLAHVN